MQPLKRPTQLPMPGLPTAPGAQNMRPGQVPQVHPGNTPNPHNNPQQPASGGSSSAAPSGQPSNGAPQAPQIFAGTPTQNLQQFLMYPPSWAPVNSPIYMVARANLDKLMRGLPLFIILCFLSIPADAGVLHRVGTVIKTPVKVIADVVKFEYLDIVQTLYWSTCTGPSLQAMGYF